MKAAFTLVVLSLVVCQAFAGFEQNIINDDDLILDQALVDSINSAQGSWKAEMSPRFQGVTVREVKALLGTDLSVESNLPVHSYDDVSDVPASFDATTQWPDFIHPIRNQEQCGSCWAFAASEVLSDRYGIATNGSENAVLSPESLVSCDKTDMGCQGGNLNNAWNYLRDTGITTDKCFPYTAGGGNAPACQSTCTDGSAMKLYKSADAYNLKSVADIQKDIMTNGPVEAGFTVYKSFMSYKSGVYTKHWYEFSALGGHAVKIVGWGTEDKTDYWLIANSWGPTWGLEGFFKIKRGVNECGIESQVYAGHVSA